MNLASTEYKEFQYADTQVILDIRRNLLFQVDELACRILNALRIRSDCEGTLFPELEGDASREDVLEALGELEELGLIHEGSEGPSASEAPQLPAVQALRLNLVHDCTLRCTYCYGRGGEYGTPGESMSYSTAVQAFEFLLQQIPLGRRGSIYFFGGEPLLAWGLLQRIIPYIRRREQEEEKKITLFLTTNGTLLTEKTIHFLHQYHVQIQVSLDGPPHIHDRMRVFPNGSGSYHHILPKIKKLLQIQGKCPIRATLDPSEPRLTQVVEHLLQIGATFVHTEPASDVIGGEPGGLSSQAVEYLKREYHHLKEECIRTIETESKPLPIHAFVRIIRRLLGGSERRRYYGCGMGRGYLAVSPRGEFYPCHRFVDHEEHFLGDLRAGPSAEVRKRYVALHVHQREPCRSCWARYLCGGGCYYEAAATQGDIRKPDPAYCGLTQAIITEAIEIATCLSQLPPEKIRGLVEGLEETVGYR
jgi:uncharacterized protein